MSPHPPRCNAGPSESDLSNALSVSLNFPDFVDFVDLLDFDDLLDLVDIWTPMGDSSLCSASSSRKGSRYGTKDKLDGDRSSEPSPSSQQKAAEERPRNAPMQAQRRTEMPHQATTQQGTGRGTWTLPRPCLAVSFR